MARQPGKRGLKAADPSKRGPVFERYLVPGTPLARPQLPPVGTSEDVDWSSAVPNIPMYCNDKIGCCTIAMVAHAYGAWTYYSTGTEVLFPDAEIVKVYSRVGGYVPGDESTDQGCLLTDVLADQVTNGMADITGKVHKLAAWATFGNPADAVLIGQALSVFGSLGGGYSLIQDNEEQFSAGKPWDYTAGAASIGGHAVCLQRRYSDWPGQDTDPFEFWTWGARQRATQAFVTRQSSELHVMVTQDWVRANGTTVNGFDLQQLISDTHAV